MLSLSEEQIKDIMFLRRMYFAKRRTLDAQRAALISRMQEQAPNPVANAARTSAFAAELRENAAEDFKFHQKAAAAVLCGVSLCLLLQTRHLCLCALVMQQVISTACHL